MSVQPPSSSRIVALDYLRGFFITVIIIDHLWRWPNIFEYITGRGEMWVSAAEDFVMISGLLVGYIYGFKKRATALSVLAKKLVLRGLMLYIWMVITTIVLVTSAWYLTSKGAIAYVPIEKGEWNELITSIVRLDYVHTLTHFLYLYAIFLIISPLVIWLLRHGAWIIVGITSLILYIVGIQQSIEWMQWQLLFFSASILGFYMDSLLQRFKSLTSPTKRGLKLVVVGATLITFLISIIGVMSTSPGMYTEAMEEIGIFGRDPLTLATIGLSFVWLIGLLVSFDKLKHFIKRYIAWLLLPFGERSLTAYIVHIIPITLCQFLFGNSDNFFINTLVCCIVVLATWSILKIPKLNSVIPR